MNKPRTILTYLVNGSPTSIKTVEFPNRLIKWISMPRKDFKNALKNREELKYSWIYFLLGEDEDGEALAYIWQATVLWKRLNDHYKNTNKDFWNTTIGFTYKDWTLNESDINFLEKELIKEATEANRYKIKNWNSGNSWLISEHRKPDMLEFIEDLKVLITNLWFNVLKKLVDKNINIDEDSFYYLTAKWSNAKWIYTEEWFTVLKWTTGPKEIVNSEIERKWYAFRNRPKLLENWIIKENKDVIIFNEDYLFSSVSAAASTIIWRSMNWREARKNKEWKTLKEIEKN